MQNQTTRRIRVAGITLSESITHTHSNARVIADTVAVPKTGTLSTRTNNTTGTLTLSSGHGIASNTADLMMSWIDPTTLRRKVIQVSAGTVAGVSVPITKTRGPLEMPPQNTAVTIARGVTYSTANIAMQQLFITCSCDMLFESLNSENEAISSNLVRGNRIFRWSSNDGSEVTAIADQPTTANDFVNDIPYIRVYNLDTYVAVAPNFTIVVCGVSE
jgi:hypothetical protein